MNEVLVVGQNNVLTLERLIEEAREFAIQESSHNEPILYGVTDGKAVGTYIEQKFRSYLKPRYNFQIGNSAEGIDFPGLLVDVKTTSVKQPQSSCPFKSASQKIYGLGYSLLIFVYDKQDDPLLRVANLTVRHTIFLQKEYTGDFQTTTGLRRIIENEGNIDDVLAFFSERMLPLDDIQATVLAKTVLQNPPKIGYLTISNALQWRLQYARAIEKAGFVDGVLRIL